ncbi:MAG: ATP-binding protein [Clostridia bacterium]|jgi:DNA replication protein DnaC
MNKETYNKIMVELRRRLSNAFAELQKKEEEVYSTVPEIEALDKKISLSGIRFGKMILTGDKTAEDSLNSEIQKLNERKQQLLKEHNFPRNYLKPSYTCQHCKDTGFVGTAEKAEKCICYKQLLIDYLYKESNIKITKDENFLNFNEMLYSDEINVEEYGIRKSPRRNILGIKEKALSFVINFKSPDEKNMFFTGPVGTGKTYMLNCIAIELLKEGYTVLYLTAPALFDIITDYKRRGFSDEEFDYTCYKNIFNVDLLIIDDLGTESHTASRYAELLNILNTRDPNNSSKPMKTIISTNIDSSQLSEFYTERVSSRIIGSFTILKFAGEDLRLLKKSIQSNASKN